MTTLERVVRCIPLHQLPALIESDLSFTASSCGGHSAGNGGSSLPFVITLFHNFVRNREYEEDWGWYSFWPLGLSVLLNPPVPHLTYISPNGSS